MAAAALNSFQPSLQGPLRLGAVVLLALLFCGVPAWAQPRAALVIGNSEYRSARLPDLPNAGGDAAATAERLRELGFAVIEGRNATAAEMRQLLQRAAAERPEEALLFFYAGHAVEAGGETFLLPSDSPEPTSLEQVTGGAVRLGEVIARLEDPARPTLLFVDACRTPAGARAERAFHPPAENLFLGFASQPGQAAVDGARQHSPFTRAMLERLLLPGTDAAAAFPGVQAETVRLTLGRQTPWSASTLRRPFAFRAAEAAVPPGG